SFFVPRSPPRSTLFPYTTLFRAAHAFLDDTVFLQPTAGGDRTPPAVDRHAEAPLLIHHGPFSERPELAVDIGLGHVTAPLHDLDAGTRHPPVGEELARFLRRAEGQKLPRVGLVLGMEQAVEGRRAAAATDRADVHV